MEFFYVIKATQKSGKPDAIVWFSAKTEARANLQLDVLLEDADIETGRGQDYNKALRTDFPVIDGLPDEGKVDFEFCTRYTLGEDGRTWLVKAEHNWLAKERAVRAEVVEEASTTSSEGSNLASDVDRVENGLTICKDDDEGTRYPVIQMPFRKQLLAQLTTDELRHHITRAEHAGISAMEMDTDNGYIQNLMLAAENCSELKKFDSANLWKYTDAIKKVFDQEKRHELSLVLQFTKTWLATEVIDRGILAREWAAGNRISAVTQQQPESQQTERYTRAVPQSTAGLRNEVAIAQLYPDAEPGKISRVQLTGAKGLQSRDEPVFATATKTLIGITDILEYDTQTIFGVTRAIKWDSEKPVKDLRQQARGWLAENGVYESGARSNGYPEWEENTSQTAATTNEETAEIEQPKTKQPEFENQGNGIFSVEGLMASSKLYGNNNETTSNEQMEEIEHTESEDNSAVSADEGAVADDSKTNTVTACTGCGAIGGGHCPDCGAAMGDSTYAEMEAGLKEELGEPEHETPVPEEQNIEFPAYFEPGRYEGLPNEVYHSANGISSTQVKDARVSLMFYHGRHVTKTIRRESSDALTFGSLAHTMALEPEKLEEEFVVFPGTPAEAFTTTDSLKAFIREYNVDKPKTEQLKLTGKKEELQEAIRAVNPDAIFADEFEQQWRESVAGKTILSSEQLELATAIQQALLNHESAGKLLRHPSRAVETSYFGMDDETGLEVRVRPDLEVEINGVRIGVDLKTISMGRVKQDGLRGRLHREIIDRDYHVSAGMYCNVADFDQFFWIFVNKDEGYHWVAVIEASEDLLTLGLLEYQKTMRSLAQAYDTDFWPAPVTDDYTDELNDFDLRKLEALRLA